MRKICFDPFLEFVKEEVQIQISMDLCSHCSEFTHLSLQIHRSWLSIDSVGVV